MININLIVNHVKARLGASHKPIELSDEAIIQCLQEVTLPTLSIYLPYFCQYTIKGSEKVEGMENTYFIPDEIEDFKVISVEAIFPAANNSLGHNYHFSPIGNSIQNMILSMSNQRFANNLASQIINPTTFQFIPPNMLRVYSNFSNDNLMIVLRTTHKKDFTTLPFGALELIKNLAFYDIALDILAIRKYFTQVNTNFAQIELDLDYLNVEDKRNELIERLRKEMLKFSMQRKLFIA